jgi:hypothetical protein
VSFPLGTCKGFHFSREVFLSRAGAVDLGFHFSFHASIPTARFGLDTGIFFGRRWARFSLRNDFAFFSCILLQFLWSDDWDFHRRVSFCTDECLISTDLPQF